MVLIKHHKWAKVTEYHPEGLCVNLGLVCLHFRLLFPVPSDEKVSDGEKRAADGCHDDGHDATSRNGPVPIRMTDMVNKKDRFTTNGNGKQDEHHPGDDC